MNNNEKYRELRSRYPRFVYEAYHWREEDDGLRLWFDFRMGDIEFHPTAVVSGAAQAESVQRPAIVSQLDWLVFNIGMIELISYWKCACPPVVEVQCGALTDGQKAFWKNLYWNGLGEFFYTNGISTTTDEFMELLSGAAQVASPKLTTNECQLSTHYIVPIGGGKDSVVTLELLRRAGKKIKPLIMNPRGATVECARVAGFTMDEVLVIRRTIDAKLLELNGETERDRTGANVHRYLNGHTPFSAMLAFYTMLASAMTGIANVALSNENSANESTVIGTSVNHQYSKSLEFEDDFREYCSNQAFNYFSFLRPLSELQIAMLFSQFTQYHDVFRSCNVGSKQDIWCGHCAKCLFAYIILSPFIEPSRLNQIFGKAMLEDLTLEHEFRQLLGLEETKPFECVGTVGEVRQALTMTIEHWYPERKPALLNIVPLDYLAPIVPMASIVSIAPIGNLTADERNLLEQTLKQANNKALN